MVDSDRCAGQRGAQGWRLDGAKARMNVLLTSLGGDMADIRDAKVPDLGSSSDVPVIEVLVAVGDRVKKDQGLVTLESDKATMEVPAPFAGIVREITVKLGDALSEGHVVAKIEVDEAGASAAARPASSPAPAASALKPAPATAATPVPAQAPVAERATAPAASAPAPTVALATTPGVDPEALPPSSPPIAFTAESLLPANVPHASPAVRVFARELGVDLAKVPGSGRGGRIAKEDVQAFVKKVMADGVPMATPSMGGGGGGLPLIPWPKVDFAKFGPVESQPLSRIQKLSGQNLARNWAMIPHVTQFDDADITEMEAFRKQLGEESKDTKVTPLVFLIKAAVAALKAFPKFNASLDGDQLVLKRYFHIGIAVDTPDGLVVPVIRDCDQKGLLDLARELGEISKKARDKKLGPADMQGGCFSISSLGGIGGTAFTPIINAPEVAILGVSRSSTKPVWNGKDFAPRLMLPLSLSYDHRVIDGADAARFTSFLAKSLGDLRRLLL
jgi:pyruvate dehydrogenase E2 component (dihydrolipoamide acetyltransferase)